MRRASSFSGGASASLYSSSGQYSTPNASAGGQRDVAADARGGPQHPRGVVIDVGDDPRRPGVLAAREHAEAGEEDHPRIRVRQRGALEPVGLEVRGVVAREGVEGRPQRRDDRVGRGRVGQRHEARQALRVDGVVRRGRADPGQLPRLRRARQLAHALAVVEAEDHAPIAPEEPAQDRRHRGGDAAAGGRVRRGDGGRAEDPAAAGGVGETLLGPGHQVEGAEIGLLDGGSPREQAVLLENDAPRLGMGPHGVGDFPGEPEPRPAVRDAGDVLAEQLLDHLAAAVGVGQGHDRVGVGVDHRLEREEAVEQRLDRGTGRAGLLEAAGQVVHHLLVAHVGAGHERADVVQADPGEVLAGDALEVRAAPLDAQDGDRPPLQVGLGQLDRGVAAAPDGQRGLGADEARGVDQEIEGIETARGLVVPVALHAGGTRPVS